MISYDADDGATWFAFFFHEDAFYVYSVTFHWQCGLTRWWW